MPERVEKKPMTLEEIRAKISAAKGRREQYPYMIAAILVQEDRFKGTDPKTICDMLGVSESYKHQIRAILQVRAAVRDFGYDLTSS
jgi:hypothetical protein